RLRHVGFPVSPRDYRGLPAFASLSLAGSESRVFEKIGNPAQSSTSAGEAGLVASVIQAMDQTDKTYRPLEKKVAEIADILGTLKLERARPVIAGILIASYLALFTIPPAVAITTSDTLRWLSQTLFHDMQEIQRAAYTEALSLSTPELVNELDAAFASLDKPEDSDSVHHLLKEPADESLIRAAEQRLNVRFGSDYLALLKTSNGVNTYWQSSETEHYLLSPVQQVERFKHELNALSDDFTETDSLDNRSFARVVRQPSDGEYQEMVFDLAALGEMLLIGRRSDGEYLLLDNNVETDAPAQVIQLYLGFEGLEGSHYNGLKSFLADQLSKLRMAAP
ncbi:MAG: SMI1/KNR4 family protein, partial [Candidatus Thiodiazotropha sp.]